MCKDKNIFGCMHIKNYKMYLELCQFQYDYKII